jgi:hypothetical protein
MTLRLQSLKVLASAVPGLAKISLSLVSVRSEDNTHGPAGNLEFAPVALDVANVAI